MRIKVTYTVGFGQAELGAPCKMKWRLSKS